MNIKTHTLSLLLAAIISAPLFADTRYQGEVVRVLDGDTIEVLVRQRPVRIRLANIDAPEKAQAFGEKSRQSLAGQVFRRQVTVVDHGGDRYGRRIASIEVGGANVNREQVRRGLAWVYARYNADPGLPQIQAEAQRARAGLWSDPQPVPPWNFRRGGK